MLHPLTLSRLEGALAQAGCPACREVERASCDYLKRLLRQHKGSEGVWQRLRGNWGLCPTHTRGLLAEEARTIPGFSTATLYRWLAEALLQEAGEDGRSRRRFRSLLEPRGGCLVCRDLGEYERTVVGDLVRALAAEEPPSVKQAYLGGEGFCVPHLRVALDLAESPEASVLLREHFLTGLGVLASRLGAFLETGAHADVWVRAAERFAGRLERT